MYDIIFRSDMTADLIDSMGNDDSVIRAAKVSTMTDDTVDKMSDAGKEKFIDFLVANRPQGDPTQVQSAEAILSTSSADAYDAYQFLLDRGIAREVARMVLPLNIYSTAYVTMNLRSLTNFLSLRRNEEGQTFPSFPQREIEMVAELMEQHANSIVPITLNAFRRNGRVAL